MKEKTLILQTVRKVVNCYKYLIIKERVYFFYNDEKCIFSGIIWKCLALYSPDSTRLATRCIDQEKAKKRLFSLLLFASKLFLPNFLRFCSL